MKWESLVSTQNLKLAWRRINTGSNLQYKRFFREAYLVYESGLDEHIKHLQKSLAARTWEPSHATRLHLPKPSGLQRPLSLLCIEDQIVLQAISNKFASKLYKKRQVVELETVFSNKLASPRDSIFFMERWQSTYSAFQEKCIGAFRSGLRWSAHFDLSAYYDTISHDLLLSIASPNNAYPQTRETIKSWLQIWSADNIATMTGHGIPQGPIASDFLAEAFFLPIDLKLQKEPFCYIRYVDDIRIFARTENEVRQAVILLEQECRHRGLIPQSTKFDIREIVSPGEAMGALPSIAPVEGRRPEEPSMSAEEAISILRSAIEGRPQRVSDKSRFRYVMFRAPENTDILNIVLRLLPRHPEHIDAIVAYLANFGNRPRIARDALEILERGMPYSYVRGELWHLVARLASPEELIRGLPLARQDAKVRQRCVALSWGVMHFLLRCQNEGLARIGKRLHSENPLSRSLLAAKFSDGDFIPGGIVTKLLKGTLIEQFAAARELQKRNLSLRSLGLRQRDISTSCRNAIVSLGVARRRHRLTQRDWISDTINNLYGCERRLVWHVVLGSEYEHALQILLEAKARFDGAYSEWLGLQDSCNDIVIRCFFEFLRNRGLNGHSTTVGRDGRLVDYGNLLTENGPFDVSFPNIANPFRVLHDRRNKLPGSHPYDKKGGSQNRWLTKQEQTALIPGLKRGLDELTAYVERFR